MVIVPSGLAKKRNRKGEVTIDNSSEIQISTEQQIYARILNISMKIGLTSIILSFALYVTRTLSPKIPLEAVSSYWAMKSHAYLELTKIEGGWAWLRMYNYGDFLNFFPIAFLAGVSIICYASIIPTLIRKKDTTYAILAVLEVLVLLGAASGILGGGAH